MTEVKKSLKYLAAYCLLLALNIPFCGELVPDIFPFSGLSSLYLTALSFCLFLRYYFRVAEYDRVKKMMLGLASMVFLLILLRCVKYSVFGPENILGRYTWYLYYVPILMIPTLLFYVALDLFARDPRRMNRRWRWVAVVTSALVLLVVTNDLHGQVFRFMPGFAEWDREYSHGWGYLAVTVWQYALYAAAIGVLIAKCAIAGGRKRAWIILLPFAMGIGMQLLLLTGKMPKPFGANPVGFPDTICFMAAGVLECCMQLGLIPTNESYREIMRLTSIPVQITDSSGRCVYRSGTAEELTPGEFALPDDTRIGEHTILRRMEVPGGFGFWKKDVAELDRLNEELADAGARLWEEAELIRLENELTEKRKKLEQRTRVYDEISRSTREQSAAISRLAREAAHTESRETRDRCRKHITLLGAYIKRYANLMLLSSADRRIDTGELGLSVAEVLRYLNMYGIPGELMNLAGGRVSGREALAVFEAFGALIENDLDDLKGVLVHLSGRDSELVFKLTLENTRHKLPGDLGEKLGGLGIAAAFEREDDVDYYCFNFPKGGEDA